MIESKDNKIIKTINFLHSKKGRNELGLFIIEGEKFVKEIPLNIEIEMYVVSESFADKNDLKDFENRSKVYVVKEHIFEGLSETISPQGILALCKKLKYTLKDLNLENAFLLICESLQDPGNLGTLIRTADAAGATAVILSEGSVEVYNSKVLRATAGSIFNIPIIENVNMEYLIGFLKENDVNTISAHLKGNLFPYEVDFRKKSAILIGNEGKGLTDETAEKTNVLVKIPMIGKAESLNASIASSILLYEVVRQRICL